MTSLLAIVFVVAGTATPVPGADVIADIQRSHIEGNVPPADAFDRILRRDLAAFFGDRLKGTMSVEYEMLRDEPTQSGVSYPKFYAWVRLMDGKAVIEEGAARLAAIEAKEFDVTDFLSTEIIQSKPTSIREVFPAAVCDRIRQKMKARVRR